MTDFIIQIEPWIDHEELEQLKKVVDSTFVSEHHLNDEFENLIKKITHSRHPIEKRKMKSSCRI